MTKKRAMKLLGVDTLAALADALEVSPSAVSQWTDPLPKHAVRRVQAALYRRNLA
jgi:DNA-binding transcriptional regulator YdaS (Cro superfamily)